MASNVDDLVHMSSEDTGVTENVTTEVHTNDKSVTKISICNEEDFTIKKTWKEDLTLNVEGKLLYVSSSVLAYASPVFSSMVDTAFENDGPRTIVVEGKKHDDFLELLRCIYPSVMKEVTMSNVMTVLPLACEYQVINLIRKCEQPLINMVDEETSPADIFQYLSVANTYSMKQLFEKCMQRAERMSQSHIKNAEKLYPLLPDVKCKIQEKMIENLESQLTQLQTALQKNTTRCTDLEDMIKSLWVGDFKESEMPEAQAVKVDFVMKQAKKEGECVMRRIRVNDMLITVLGEIEQFYHFNTNTTVTVSMICQPAENLNVWSSKVFAKLRILNRTVGREYECTQKRFTFDKNHKKHALFEKSYQIDEGFRRNGELQCELYLLVDSTVRKAKQSPIISIG